MDSITALNVIGSTELYLLCLACAVATASGLLFRRLLRAPELPNLDRVWEISPERFRPMANLLSGEDLEFLRAQRGFTSEMETRFRRGRYAAYRSYLRRLRSDFNTLHASARYLAAHAPMEAFADAGAFSKELMRLKLQFEAAGVRLWLAGLQYRIGFASADLPVASVLESLAETQRRMQGLVMASSAAA